MSRKPLRPSASVILKARLGDRKIGRKSKKERYWVKPERDVVDIFQIAVPACIAVAVWYAGNSYSHQKDREQQRTQEAAQARLDWEEASGYLKLLTSSNQRDQLLGLKIIEQLRYQGRFPKGLEPVVEVLKRGPPSDPVTQAAARISTSTPTPRRAEPGPPSMNQGPIEVRVQYTGQAQACLIGGLNKALEGIGFVKPAAEVVSRVPAQTTISFFSADAAGGAHRIEEMLAKGGVKALLEDRSASPGHSPPQIVVALGGELGARFLADGRGNLLGDEKGNALVAEECKPFTFGETPFGVGPFGSGTFADHR